VGGFVFPGDRIDLMLTQTVEGESGQGLRATETILTNLRVLATDQSTETTTTEDGRTVVRAFRTVTLEVTPRIAEKIAVSQTIGTLSLSLRSIADNQGELDRAIAAGDVEIPAGATPEQEARILRQVVSRPQDGGSTFVTGGDVSRFQRRTMAPPANSNPGPAAQAPAYSGAVAPARPSGPSVRVTRGKSTTEVPVQRGSGALLDRPLTGGSR
jgi:pilus assembly protein CpaB